MVSTLIPDRNTNEMSAKLTAAGIPDLRNKAAFLADRFRREASETACAFPANELRELAEAGLLGITLPRRLGGSGLGFESGSGAGLLPVLKEIGRGNLSLGRVYEGHVHALLLIEQFGSDSQLEQAADDVLRRESVYGVWNTGPIPSAKLVRLANGNYQLSGSKTFATGASRIESAVVTASLPDGGWQMCLVPLFKEDLVIHEDSWRPLGMEASESFTVEFSDIELSADHLIGKPGDYYVEPGFTSETFRYAAVQLGGAKALFDSCCQFTRTMQRDSEPFQLQRIAQMAVLLETGDLWLDKAGGWREKESNDPSRLMTHARMMRIAVEEICTRIIQLVEISVGARGLMEAEPFARALRDLQMYLRQAGYDHAFHAVGQQVLEEIAPHARNAIGSL